VWEIKAIIWRGKEKKKNYLFAFDYILWNKLLEKKIFIRTMMKKNFYFQLNKINQKQN